MLHAETFISGNSAILAATPFFDGLRSALKTIFFIFAHPNEIHEPSDQIGTFSTVSTQPGANKEVGPPSRANKRFEFLRYSRPLSNSWPISGFHRGLFRRAGWSRPYGGNGR